MSEYLVRFTAVNPDPLDEGDARRLADAIRAIPGVDEAGGAALGDGQSVTGVFAIEVDQAMADAARDGSRMANGPTRPRPKERDTASRTDSAAPSSTGHGLPDRLGRALCPELGRPHRRPRVALEGDPGAHGDALHPPSGPQDVGAVAGRVEPRGHRGPG